MVTKLTPEANKVYFINKYTMIHILEGMGSIQVDFKNFHDWDDKLIFLEKGQYIKFLSDGFIVRKIEFEDQDIFRNREFRVLFKHLVSIGYINFDECTDCQKYLESSILSKPAEILDISSRQWYWQNPFNAKNDEYHIIFDVKDIVDSQYRNHLRNDEIVKLLDQYDLNAQAIYTQKVGVTISKMLANKRLTESKKEISFTDKSIKEIAYDFGYKDPAYFNRVFKSNTGHTPAEFRANAGFDERDTFVNDVLALLHAFHGQQRNAGFYADKMNLSVKTLSRRVKEKLQVSVGQLIRQEIIKTAKRYLKAGMPVNEIARILNFEEPNHFSAFFKQYVGLPPSEYPKQKVQ
ncbi:hypothetical protein GCM10009122_41360 [Fulvivirga kasyanovii]|uniref:AraC family transcriptional regulator n=1 Tax=Fulvivirga kasyanovii TaxID=396812 RepID=A0ABW9RW32_9BACT|nr:AraC family transcriptional regulator [Fulvivirga kasyanovii]MTI27469.1 AraC family transcriptional regulator [Fulvivirga kasyanovii]